MITVNNNDNNNVNELLFPVQSTEGYNFIVPQYEYLKLKPSINSSKTFSELLFYRDIILSDRKRMSRELKRGYKPLRVLEENDLLLWFVRKELFKETVAVDIRERIDFTYEDRLILAGVMDEQTSKILSKGLQ
ncbi:hypothetical protein [Bacillus nitratireducens]|uniref:hypothetical protein n=1 Tax=Bacillus nitratireducens TaxID=2026193 RepID=UPI0011A3E09F|nr:hypothetical protein [Bacillus nitratireducens]